MSAEQSLVGAMGCASWRSHFRLREHASIAPHAGTIRGSVAPVRAGGNVLGLNEVGVTDLVMAVIWRFGPGGAGYAISQSAEANHFGADIAIIHPSTSRVLLYQAKLASEQAGAYSLKSPVTAGQLRLLNRRSVTLDGIRFQVTGRLALYQADMTPFLHRCGRLSPFGPWWDGWWWHHRFSLTATQPTPQVGKKYYEEVLRSCGCSPSGVVAASVSGHRTALRSISVSATWPWEFDTYEWFRESSPLDGPSDWRHRQDQLGESPPEFEPYRPTPPDGPNPERAQVVADQLVQQLRLPARHRLFVILLG